MHDVAAASGSAGNRNLVVVAVALSLSLLGCGSPAPTGAPVDIFTGVPTGFEIGRDACSTGVAIGLLLVDEQYGTAIADTRNLGVTSPVMWPPGFTGRQSDSDVQVLDAAGNVVATTGRTYRLEGGYWPEHPTPFFACGEVIQQ